MRRASSVTTQHEQDSEGSDDGKRDLWNSPQDIIGSVANYFRAHGWKQGDPVATLAQVTGDDYHTWADER